ncbi:hypothetical protein UYSO10_4428 [Kosakonia radicincitans]|nr:hypothetical protein UYSO10_4428 [Kosakonia radicincitans]
MILRARFYTCVTSLLTIKDQKMYADRAGIREHVMKGILM